MAAEFLEHATEEQEHADVIAARIVQLGGEPNFSPDGLSTRSHSEYVEGTNLVDMIREDLVAERVAIDSYCEMIRYLGDRRLDHARACSRASSPRRRSTPTTWRTCSSPSTRRKRVPEDGHAAASCG